MTIQSLQCGPHVLDLSQPRIMGILNTTPDSFSDGGLWQQADKALEYAHAMVAQGADIIDIGGESTRPGAADVTVDEEIRRVVPLVERMAAELPVPISVDTSKPEVMLAAAAAGAGLLNDVYALRRPQALQAAASTGLPVCLMHMQGEPRTMQQQPQYGDVTRDVIEFLKQRIEACVAAGIARDRLLIDPGFGFGKTLSHNLQLLRELESLRALELPILAGLSRKSMLGTITGREVGDRVHASVAAALIAAQHGAAILRVHDVAATRDTLAVLLAMNEA